MDPPMLTDQKLNCQSGGWAGRVLSLPSPALVGVNEDNNVFFTCFHTKKELILSTSVSSIPCDKITL